MGSSKITLAAPAGFEVIFLWMTKKTEMILHNKIKLQNFASLMGFFLNA